MASSTGVSFIFFFIHEKTVALMLAMIAYLIPGLIKHVNIALIAVTILPLTAGQLDK